MSNETGTEVKGKGQALRLSIQQELGGGPLTIFGEAAQKHDLAIREVTAGVLAELAKMYPNLEFRQRTFISKNELNQKLNSFDNRLGQTIFVPNSSIKPDGGITEVKDKYGNWRIILIGESKHQGNDIDKILSGVLQGKNKDQDIMAAGNAIERMHKNVLELRNYMLDEKHFPYVVFLQGSNFLIESFSLTRPDGREVELNHESGTLNRIDRLTASNFSRPINENHCLNIVIKAGNIYHTIQTASLYCRHSQWTAIEMARHMLDVSITSLNILSEDLS